MTKKCFFRLFTRSSILTVINIKEKKMKCRHKKNRIIFATYLLSFMFFLVFCNPLFAAPYWEPIGPGDADWVNMVTVNQDGVFYVATDIGGIYKSIDAGGSYEAINNGITNYHINDISIDPYNPDIIYAGTRGGFFKTTDGGSTWEAKRAGIGGPGRYYFTAPISSIVIYPGDTNTVFATVGLLRIDPDENAWINVEKKGTIFKSTDSGESWSKINTGVNNIPGDTLIYRLVIGATNSELYIATQYGIYKSTDGGVNWVEKNLGLPVPDPWTHFLLKDTIDSSTLYLTIKNGTVYRSTDNGDNWTIYNNGLPTTSINFHRLAMDSNGVLYVAGSTYTPPSGIWKKTSAGADWQSITTWGSDGNMTHGWYGTKVNVTSIAIDPSDPTGNTIYMSGTTTLYKTVNAGVSWSQIYTNISGAGGDEYAHRGIDVFGSCNAVAIDPKDPDKIYIDSGDHGLFRSANGGKTWQRANDGMSIYEHVYDILVDPVEDVVYVTDSSRYDGNRGGVAKSTDHGVTWTPINEGLPNATMFALALDTSSPTANRTIYAAPQYLGVYRSEDGGGSWSNYSTGLPVGLSVLSLRESPVQPSLIFAAVSREGTNYGGLYKRGKNDSSWIKVNVDQELPDAYDVAINPLDPAIIYVATRRTTVTYPAGVWKNSRGGSGSWTRVISDNEWFASIAVNPINPDEIIAGTMIYNYDDVSTGNGLYRLYRSSEDGAVLENIENDMPVRRFQSVVFDPVSPERLYIGANGSGGYTHSDLAGHWPLNEDSGDTVNDASGNDNDTVTSGSPTWVNGQVGSHALQFDGLDDYFSVDNVSLWNDKGFTISVWVNPDGTQALWAPMVYNWRTGVRFYYENRISFVLWNAANDFTQVVSETSLPDNQWSLVTAVYDDANDEMRIYINGNFDRSLPNVGGLNADYFDGSMS
ncbi:MAG TPA: hypothetical protein ENH01_04520, partial [Nitrospirae bacterium]|nr:hypothetical protein [Nitrospirota bacterium]